MIVLIDNYDSFTFNLVQSLRTRGATVQIHRNDRIQLTDIARLNPTAIVLSPGPGRPEDAGITPAVVSWATGRVPLLGVCLGHQAIGLVNGATIARAGPIHGKASVVDHTGHGVFAGLDAPLQVGRYHSLVIERASLPAHLRVTAWTEDDLVMAVEHTGAAVWGVQFHPESILTPAGDQLIGNFLDLAAAAQRGRR